MEKIVIPYIKTSVLESQRFKKRDYVLSVTPNGQLWKLVVLTYGFLCGKGNSRGWKLDICSVDSNTLASRYENASGVMKVALPNLNQLEMKVLELAIMFETCEGLGNCEMYFSEENLPYVEDFAKTYIELIYGKCVLLKAGKEYRNDLLHLVIIKNAHIGEFEAKENFIRVLPTL